MHNRKLGRYIFFTDQSFYGSYGPWKMPVTRFRSVACVLAAALLAFGPTSPARAGNAPLLLENSRNNLALLQARGEEILSLALVSRPGENAATDAVLRKLDGRVHYRFDPVDFMSAALKAGRLPELLARAPLVSLTVDSYGPDYLLNQLVTSDVPDSPGAGSSSHPAVARALPDLPGWPPRPGTYPLDEPYDVLADMDGRGLRRNHPEYDGRGVVIAHVEVMFTDFLLPELQFGTTLDGKRAAKFVDVINVPSLLPSLEADPSPWSGGWTGWQWGRLGKLVRRHGDRLTDAGKRYRVPRSDGAYRSGEISLPTRYLVGLGLAEGSKEGQGSLSRGTAQRTAIPMLWSDAHQRLWLDVNRDGDFTDQPGVEVFARGQTFGELGTDDPRTDVRETIAYAVKKDGSLVSLNFGVSGHAALVAGAAAGNRGPAGRMEGIAPGARFIAIGTGDTTSSYARALIRAFSDPRSDLVLAELLTRISGMDDVLKQGQSTLAILIARLSETYDKPCFITSSNTHGMSSILDMSVPSQVMAVSAYQSAYGTLINSGMRLAQYDNLHGVGGEGPAGNGALKPDLLVPANPISLEAGFLPAERENQRYQGLFQLPPGYGIGGGTSTAAPVAAGAAAVLVSAAKQNSLVPDARAIQDSLRNSARLLENVPQFKQGNGLVRLEAAWRLLQSRSAQEPIGIVGEAPVLTVSSHLLPSPHRGPGWFEREGWPTGEARSRTIILTRRSGPRDPMTFRLHWRGDWDRVFGGPEEITLPLGQPTPLVVTAQPATPGAHSALLELQHPDVDGPVYRMPATVVAAYEFNAQNAYRFETETHIAPLDRRNFYFRVPAGSDAFTVAFEHNNERIRVKVSPPDRQGRGYHIDPVKGGKTVSFAAPRSGVWEVAIFDTGRAAFDWSHAHETVPATPVRLSADVTQLSVARIAPDRFAVTNRLAAFTGGAASASLGSMLERELSIQPGRQQVYEIDIEAGVELMVVELEGEEASAPGLALYDCTAENVCHGARKSLGPQAVKRVMVENPAAGRWKAVVDASAMVGASPRRVGYREYFLHPRFGSLSVDDSVTPREVGEVWTVGSRIWKAAAQPHGRVPIALFSVRDPQKWQLHVKSRTSGLERGVLPYPFDNLDGVGVRMGMQLLELP